MHISSSCFIPPMNYVPDLVFIFGYGSLAFLIAMLTTPPAIRMLRRFGFVKQIREVAVDGKDASVFIEHHKHKAGTPNGGGIIIWGTVALVLLLSRVLAYAGIGYFLPFDGEYHSILNRSEVWLPFFTLIFIGFLGAFDDYLNANGVGKQKGISAWKKMLWLIIFAFAGALWFHYKLEWNSIHIPRVGDFNIGFWYVPLFVFVIISTANAVNVTDGLDGLAGGLLAIAFTAFSVIAYIRNNPSLGSEHMIFLATFCAVIVGALAGFLWYNVSPAKLFMGDTGSLALGATLGVIAMMTNTFIVLIIIGLIFYWEVFTSFTQILSKKFLKRKIYKAAPFHHALQACGWPESNIVMRLWIIGMMLAVVGVIIAIIGSGIR